MPSSGTVIHILCTRPTDTAYPTVLRTGPSVRQLLNSLLRSVVSVTAGKASPAVLLDMDVDQKDGI